MSALALISSNDALPEDRRNPIKPPELPARELLERTLLAQQPRRRLPKRLKVFFLRRLRMLGEVSTSAKLVGVPLSTVYRWRERDPIFRRRWDQAVEIRQQIVEDELMMLAVHGERREVYWRDQLVGLRNYRNVRAMILLLQRLDKQAAATG
jgi:hypothetical protein